MADPNNNRNNGGTNLQQDLGSSTISYLPILFANGYPTSLEKMTQEQLELFIPFLIKCSLNLKTEEEPKTAPKWWPTNLEFTIPFEKPKDFKKNWKEAMKNLVLKCYDYHKQPFLLKYSKDLSTYDTANFRYVRDSDTTTALWSRDPKKLLLTFRNELMQYDKKRRRQLWKKDEAVNETEEADSTFDIFLCDYCDATFVSEEAYTEHEKKCNQTPETEQTIENIVISDDEDDDDEEEKIEIEMMGEQTDFLAYFSLIGMDVDELPRRNSLLERSLSPKKKKKAVPRTRICQKDREREYTVPFSSPAGMVLTKKPQIDEDYNLERINRNEDFCAAKPTTKVTRTKIKFPQNNTEKTLMRQMRKTRPYYWPKRQLASSSREKNFEFLNRWLVEDCKPFAIITKKLTNEDIKSYKDRLIKIKEQREHSNCVDLISDSDSESIELGDLNENDVSDAMMKLNGQFLSVPIPSTSSSTIINTTSSSSTRITPYKELSNLKYVTTQYLPNGDIKISQRTSSTRLIQSTTFHSTDVNNIQNPCDDIELIDHHNEKRSSSIHEWLSNVSGENFQITT
ncbi:uncharacterized protein ova isoform X2 [Chironomus tepperi]